MSGYYHDGKLIDDIPNGVLEFTEGRFDIKKQLNSYNNEKQNFNHQYVPCDVLVVRNWMHKRR